MYVTADQLSSILKDKAFKLSRTSRTNDSTENIIAGDSSVTFEVEEYGYVCLSSSITSAMMWGQYADRGRGACLVFSAKLSADMENKRLHVDYYLNRRSKATPSDPDIYLNKVTYTEGRVTSEEARRSITLLLTSKSNDWKYEREYRILIPLSQIKKENIKEEPYGDFSYKYLDNRLIPLLSRIVLGVNNTTSILDMEKRTNNALGTHYYPIRVTKASLDLHTFSINPNLDRQHIPIRRGEEQPTED